LRGQKSKCAPDIRIEKGGKTIFVLEIKAKAGWIQAFISPETYKKDKENGKYNPDDVVKKQNEQLFKYKKIFNTNNIYMFLPTLESAHRKKHKTTYGDYKINFNKNTDLPKNNLIILSKDLNLNLSRKNIDENTISKEKLTNEFEMMLNKIIK
jgi:hypothetical protein